MFPRITGYNAINGGHHSYTDGSHPELKYSLLLGQIVNSEISQRSTEFDQRLISSLSVIWRSVNPDVHILGLKGFLIFHDGVTAH